MAVDREEALRLYIERVSALERERGRTLALDEMKSVARDLGISAEDLAAADGAAAAHVERGVRFLEYQRWDDAISELQNALVLVPGSLNVTHALASAYAGRWRAGGNAGDRALAESHARDCLQLDPSHTPAYELLNNLDTSSGSSRTRGISRRAVVAVTATFLLMLLAFIVVAEVRRHHRQTVVVVEEPDPPPTPTEPASVGVPEPSHRPTPMPITWECARPELANVEVSPFYSKGLLDGFSFVNTGGRPIHEVVFRIRVSGEEHEIVANERTIATGENIVVKVPRGWAREGMEIEGAIVGVRM